MKFNLIFYFLILLMPLTAFAQAGRFTDNRDDTVIDNSTDLMWVADPSRIGGNFGSPGIPSTMSWNKAINNCRSLTYAGYSDWRLPSYKELRSIVDMSRLTAPAIDGIFTCEESYYWTRTSHTIGRTIAWAVYFGSALVYTDGKDFAYYVRPVRDSHVQEPGAPTQAKPNILTELGVVYVGMPKEDLEKAGYTKLMQKGYRKEGNEEWITYLNWTTEEPGDLVTFYVVDGKVKGWKEK